MTDYELGFARGEEVAWRERGQPLPTRPAVTNEAGRGYWDARLPRSPAWERNRVRLQRFSDSTLREVA